MARHRALYLFFASLLQACSKIEDPSLLPVFNPATALPPPEKTAVAANPQRSVFFGDLHVHTSLSTDAFTMGVRALPEDAYTFARGGTISHGAGYPIRISRPLDFLAVTDHSEYMGVSRATEPEMPLTKRPLRDLLLNGNKLSISLAWLQTMQRIRTSGFGEGDVDRDIVMQAWQTTIAAAERNNKPGVFTAFIGYEWSAFGELKDIHLHRNIIYRSSHVADIPFSSLQSQRPEDLWDFLEQQNQSGKTCFAIPHNANLSNGSMYQDMDSDGKALTASYASKRMRYEPISEIFQVKGQSETHPRLSPEDEFANFEIVEAISDGRSMVPAGGYARDALRRGIELSHSDNFNPYRFGVIGSSDGHNASSPTDEASYHGKLPMMDGSAALRLGTALLLAKYSPAKTWGSGGLAAVWAQENTRASLFDALRAKETYATSGPRIRLRFFGGWRYSAEMLRQHNLVDIAYKKGVAMGGDLKTHDGTSSPSFAVWAMKDPEGANLDRIQIVKGWVNEQGESAERIYDIAVSNQRLADPESGDIAPVGNTVDANTGSYDNSIGDVKLAAFWRDPDFDPRQQAFYYTRVLEIPTPRWSTFDALKLGLKPPQPVSIQERAVSSAIWYQP
jgi:hypothetical protein